ncbi:unnamed protein product [Symbiodinium pilosum]|uniref:Uncharacterized protein n=1 Tax=Symbiodinium pilosum TaxID=2952 RepID=A0A812X342_SYMPI|nr:unnamed protein product [Symbiodinium pilosum]
MRSVWDCSEKELICAAAEGRISDVKAILRRVQNPNVWDEHGESPLGCAVRGGHTEVVRLLLNARARTERKATKQVPMLHVACERGDLEIVCMLLAYRADKNSKDRLGTTALIRASAADQLDIVHVLVYARADTNKTDKFNGTALKYAASEGHTEIVRALLTAKADLSVADWLGMTAVRWASCRGQADTKQLLMDAGADESGYTPTPFVCLLFLGWSIALAGAGICLKRFLQSYVFVPTAADPALDETCPG